MAWTSIIKNRRTELVCADSNINAENYVEDVLRPYVHSFPQSLGLDVTLVHDNARSDTA